MTKEILAERTLGAKQDILRPGERDAAENYVLVIHGGAGNLNRENLTPEKRAEYKADLARALKAGYEVLKLGGEAMDAAVAAVTIMEDSPLFNAGKGSAFNIAGKNELEASIMLSKPPAAYPMPTTRRGTSVTLLTRTKNPSHLVRALYLAPGLAPHPMLSGETAEALGSDHLGIQTIDPSYFWTEARWREHRTWLGLPVGPIEPPCPPNTGSEFKNASETTKPSCPGCCQPRLVDILPKGTVGAVALDVRGCIATVTSTGGRTNKLVGRIGDTPVMGSGFWAEEWERQGGTTQCGVGVSGTGDGDYYIRRSAASTVARRMQYLEESVEEATRYVINLLFKDGGLGGIIALDRQGNVALQLNCDSMHRGVIRTDGVPYTAVCFDDQLSRL